MKTITLKEVQQNLSKPEARDSELDLLNSRSEVLLNSIRISRELDRPVPTTVLEDILDAMDYNSETEDQTRDMYFPNTNTNLYVPARSTD